MRTVKEVSQITGVSVRTLHHYDTIGLLKPTRVTEAGYRLYDDTALWRLQSILLFRELEFPLKEIGRILDTPGFDQRKALEQQIHMLELRQAHLSDLIAYARLIQQTGATHMNFSVFDKSQMDQYAAQAKAAWGGTEAYQEFEAKTAGQSSVQQQAAGSALMGILQEFGSVRHLAPECQEVQALVAKLQAFITQNFYTCTPQILQGLGQMYAAGGSMTEQIDAAGGKGTAQFAGKAISIYCQTP